MAIRQQKRSVLVMGTETMDRNGLLAMCALCPEQRPTRSARLRCEGLLIADIKRSTGAHVKAKVGSDVTKASRARAFAAAAHRFGAEQASNHLCDGYRYRKFNA